MNRRHEQIARYIDGAMNRDERAGFEKRMSVDAALRHRVDAERSIRATIAREVAALPVEHGATRAAMLSALAALPQTPPGGSAGTLPRTAPRTAPRPRSPLLRWLGAGGASAVIVVAGYVLATRGREEPRESSRAAAREVSTPPDTAGIRSAPMVVDEIAVENPSSIDTPRRDRDAAHQSGRSPAASGRSAADSPPQASPTPPAVERSDTRATPNAQGPPAERELRVIDRDSVRLRVGVEDLQRKP